MQVMHDINVYVNDRAQESTIQDGEDVEVSFDDAVFMMTDLVGHRSLTAEQREKLLELANDIIRFHFEAIADQTCQSCIGEFDENKCPHCRVYRDTQTVRSLHPAEMFLKTFLT